MNHEQQPRPKHRNHDDQPTPEQTGDAYVRYVAERAPNPGAARLVQETYQRRGTPFAIYLALRDVDRYSDTTESDFQNSYIGFYSDRQALVTDTIETFGWKADLDRLLRDDPRLRAMVSLDPEQIWDFTNDHYEVVDLDGGLYVFEPAP